MSATNNALVSIRSNAAIYADMTSKQAGALNALATSCKEYLGKAKVLDADNKHTPKVRTMLEAASIGYIAGYLVTAGDNRPLAEREKDAKRIAGLDKRTGNDLKAWGAWRTAKSRLLKALEIAAETTSNNPGGRSKGSGEGKGEGAANENAKADTPADLLAMVQAAIAAFIANGERVKAPRKVMDTFHDWQVEAQLLKA